VLEAKAIAKTAMNFMDWEQQKKEQIFSSINLGGSNR